MKTSLVAIICAAIIGSLAVAIPAGAQEKTAKACEQEWRSDKATYQAKGITEKAYVEKCRSGAVAAKDKKSDKSKEAKSEPATTPAAGKEKTAKACADEWRANKASNQAKGVTEKAYVETCRSGGTAATTAAAPASAPIATRKTSTPMAPTQASRSTAPAAGVPEGANQYAAETQAKARCLTGTVVWANLDSKIYHFSGHDDYGHTKKGAYMCEKDAMSQGMRAAKNEKHP